MAFVTAYNLTKNYTAGEIIVKAIRGVDFTIEPDSFVSFVGPSDSGKSTLLNMIGWLDPPTGGELTVSDRDVTKLSSKQSAIFRGDHIGFIFSTHDPRVVSNAEIIFNLEDELLQAQNGDRGGTNA